MVLFELQDAGLDILGAKKIIVGQPREVVAARQLEKVVIVRGNA